MRHLAAMAALVCVAMIPGLASAQGVANPNTCSMTLPPSLSTGNLTVEGTGSQAGQTLMLTGLTVTYPTTLSNDAVIFAYQQGAWAGPGVYPIPTEVTVRVNATNTAEGFQDVTSFFDVYVEIVDPPTDPTKNDAFLAPLDAVLAFPQITVWTPIDLTVEFSQGQLSATSGGQGIDCNPDGSPAPFETTVVVPPPCDDEIDCNFPNGSCDFWGNCVCEDFFNGADCACSDETTCNDFGTCNAAGNCVCQAGRGGPDCLCQDAIDCSGNGECTPSGTCICDPDFGAPDCSCDPDVDCNGNGDCDPSGACVCGPAWTGPDCLDPTCIPARDCNSNGTCDEGECVCDPGYTGDDCGTAVCIPGVNCTSVPVGVANLYVHSYFNGSVTTVENSTIAWQNQDFSVFGQWSVNLGLVPGINPLTVPIGGGVTVTAPPPTNPAYGTFDAVYLSASPGVLTFDSDGDFVCPDNVDVCGPQLGEPSNATWYANFVTTSLDLSGAVVDDVGPGTLPTTVGGSPVTYALDGALACNNNFGVSQCYGTGYLTASVAENTPAGLAVPVDFDQVFIDPSDPTGQTIVPVSVTVTFDEVVGTGIPANTTLVTTSQTAGSISSDFELLDSVGLPVVFLDITTTAEYEEDITVCLEYSDELTDECELRLLHNADGPPDSFNPATLEKSNPDCTFPPVEMTCENIYCINTVTNEICGTAMSLSPWVLALYVGNEAPIADAGPDEAIIAVDSTVQLDGSQSYDLDGDEFTYAWTLSKPLGSDALLDDPSSATPSFMPDLYGTYTATLIVTDDNGLPSLPDQVLVSFENVAPVADAGPNQTVRVGDAVSLDGSGSSDPNGDALTYEWSLFYRPVGSTADLDDLQAQMPELTPDVAGTYEAQLIVSDGVLNSVVPASVSIVATTAEGDLVDVLEEAVDVVNGLDASVFKNKSLQKNMAKHIGQAAAQVDQGRFHAAGEKLEAVLRKTDGCATGGSPDSNDWIVDCAAQSQVHPLIVQALVLVDEILGS